MTLRVLDLFSGIGGFSLGLERAGGFETVAFCEIEPYCQKVLAKHWPGVPVYDDVKTITADRLRADGIIPDVITGGFPCQDVSAAGKQSGIDGDRSGLWSELARIIGEVRPRYAILENVTNLLAGDNGRWFGQVLGDLAALGYDAEWHCVSAAHLGAPHIRDRVWIVTYPDGRGLRVEPKPERRCDGATESAVDGAAKPVADTNGQRLEGQRRNGHPQGWQGPILGPARLRDGAGHGQRWWESEPNVRRVAHGVPRRVDRLRGLGNAIVPQMACLIGEAILAGQSS